MKYFYILLALLLTACATAEPMKGVDRVAPIQATVELVTSPGEDFPKVEVEWRNPTELTVTAVKLKLVGQDTVGDQVKIYFKSGDAIMATEPGWALPPGEKVTTHGDFLFGGAAKVQAQVLKVAFADGSTWP